MIPQAPPFWYLHECGRCGARIRRSRQHTLAAWYVRNRLEPHAWPMRWTDPGGTSDCGSPYARRQRRERGWPELMSGTIDARHYPVLPERSDT